MSSPASSQRETVYVDVDDEITAVIDKVQSAKGKIVALVLPKRAAVFQSVVNMKLLKRAATQQRKSLVLITSEAAILPLAGAVGLHVAQSLQSKPAVPTSPGAVSDAIVDADEPEVEVGGAPDPAIDRTRPVGELAAMATADEDAIEVGDVDQEPGVPKKPAIAKKVFNRKLAVPNFELFRSRLFLLIFAIVVLGVGWLLAFRVLPKATVTIVTNNSTVNASVALTASLGAKETDAQKLVVPALQKQYKKTDTQKVTATGKKDMGTKASGSVTLALTDCSSDQVTIPQGAVVSSSGMSFLTQADVLLKSVKIGPSCQNNNFKDFSTATVKVSAQAPGDQYNLDARAYTVAGLSKVSASGSAMTGGTSKQVTVVSQTDVDAAKQKILDAAKQPATDEVTKQLKGEGYFPLSETFTIGDPLVTASPNVDSEATDVTVTVAVTYTMVGVKQDGVTQLVEAEIKKKIDTAQQNILNNGMDQASIKLEGRQGTDTPISVAVTALAGVQQDAEEIKRFVIGKKRGEAIDQLSDRPGVKSASIEYNLPWVYSTPSSTSKITAVFKKADEARK